MDSFGVFRGFRFKGSVFLECIKCDKKEELQLLKHVDIVGISNQADCLCEITFVYTDRGVYCLECYKRYHEKYKEDKKYQPKVLRRGVIRQRKFN